VSISGKPTAFIGTPPEMFYTHLFPPCRSALLPLFSPIGFSRLYLLFVATQGGLLSRHINATKFASSLCVVFWQSNCGLAQSVAGPSSVMCSFSRMPALASQILAIMLEQVEGVCGMSGCPPP
jgi:hypothetical protein